PFRVLKQGGTEGPAHRVQQRQGPMEQVVSPPPLRRPSRLLTPTPSLDHPARKRHKGSLGTSSTRPKQSTERWVHISGFKSQLEVTRGSCHQLPTERSIDTRPPQEIANIIPWVSGQPLSSSSSLSRRCFSRPRTLSKHSRTGRELQGR